MRTAAAVRAAQAEVEKHDRGSDHIVTVNQDSRDDAAALAHSTECVQDLRRTCARFISSVPLLYFAMRTAQRDWGGDEQ